MALTAEQRSQHARRAALIRWSREDPGIALVPAHEGFQRKWLDLVDADRVLPEVERQRRAARAMRAHMISLALKSSTARRKGSP